MTPSISICLLIVFMLRIFTRYKSHCILLLLHRVTASAPNIRGRNYSEHAQIMKHSEPDCHLDKDLKIPSNSLRPLTQSKVLIKLWDIWHKLQPLLVQLNQIYLIKFFPSTPFFNLSLQKYFSDIWKG